MFSDRPHPQAENIDPLVGDAVRAAAESLRLDVRRRRHLDQLRAVEAASHHVDYAVRNVRMLARAGVTLTRLPAAAPPDLITALQYLGDAARAAGQALAASITEHGGTVDRYADQARESALDAVRIAGRLFGDSPPLPVVMIVGQVRATAIDLLRGSGAREPGRDRRHRRGRRGAPRVTRLWSLG